MLLSVLGEISKSRHSTAIFSPSSNRATNQRRSSILEHHCHGIASSLRCKCRKVLPMWPEFCVTIWPNAHYESNACPHIAAAPLDHLKRPGCDDDLIRKAKGVAIARHLHQLPPQRQ